MSASVGLKSWGMLILLGIIWGASFMGVSFALTGFGPLWVAALRIAIAAAILMIAAYMSGVGLPDRSTAKGRRIWVHAVGFAIFSNALPFSLLSWAQQYVTSGFAGITMAVVPLFVLPLAHVVLREFMTPRKIVGFLMGFAGVLVLIGPAALGGVGGLSENMARLACVGASACYAIGAIITRTAPSGPLLSYSAAGLSLGAVLTIAMALLYEGAPPAAPPAAWAGVLYLGLFPTALATLLLVRVINDAGPTFLALVNYQVPVWAVILGMLFLGEALPGSFLTALVLILGGLALSQARAWRFRP